MIFKFAGFSNYALHQVFTFNGTLKMCKTKQRKTIQSPSRP